MRKTAILGIAVLALTFAATAARGQVFGTPASGNRQSVEFLYPEQVAVPAGKPATVALHFRVAPGMHINAHTPFDADLIPTVLTLQEGSGVKLEGATYPKGESYTPSAESKTKLNVYTGEFVIEARLLATAGNHLAEARLRYQACDNALCMPPRTLLLAIGVEGK
jgi:hypothetical protein